MGPFVIYPVGSMGREMDLVGWGYRGLIPILPQSGIGSYKVWTSGPLALIIIAEGLLALLAYDLTQNGAPVARSSCVNINE